MKASNLLWSVLLTSAMAMPAAMAQNAGGGAGGAGGAGAGNVGTASAATLPSQRVTNETTFGTGALVTVSPSGVRQIQQQLNRLGFNAGFVNGVWNRSTEIAMTEFQRAHGLDPTGNLNFSSIAALGLWNDIFGNPIGTHNQAIAGAQNTGVPPARGYGENLPSQRSANESVGGGMGGGGMSNMGGPNSGALAGGGAGGGIPATGAGGR